MTELAAIYDAAQDIVNAQAMGLDQRDILNAQRALRRRLDAAPERVRAAATSSAQILRAIHIVY